MGVVLAGRTRRHRWKHPHDEGKHFKEYTFNTNINLFISSQKLQTVLK